MTKSRFEIIDGGKLEREREYAEALADPTGEKAAALLAQRLAERRLRQRTMSDFDDITDLSVAIYFKTFEKRLKALEEKLDPPPAIATTLWDQEVDNRLKALEEEKTKHREINLRMLQLFDMRRAVNVAQNAERAATIEYEAALRALK